MKKAYELLEEAADFIVRFDDVSEEEKEFSKELREASAELKTLERRRNLALWASKVAFDLEYMFDEKDIGMDLAYLLAACVDKDGYVDWSFPDIQERELPSRLMGIPLFMKEALDLKVIVLT